MANQKPIDTEFQNSLTPEDQAILGAVVKRMTELKKVITPIVDQAKPYESERKKLGEIVRKTLLKYEDLPAAIEIGGIPVSYVQGEEYLDEQALLMAGVSKTVIENCKRRKPGFFVVDRQGGKAEKG